jgi:hypothetical protein
MMTLRLFSGKFESVPAATSWYLADLGEARGKQELFTRQSPQRLKVLREHALIESAVSSNRIEGVEGSQGWHEGKHDPWPYINFILSIIKMAYREFEQRLGQLQSPKGEKTSLVLHAIDSAFGPFSVAEIQNKCPNVSVDMVRRVLKNLREKDQIECLGRGQNARWQKTAKWQLGNVD